MPSVRVCFVVTELDPGGAERALQRLALALRDRGDDVSVFSLTSVGPIGEELITEGIPVDAGNMRFPTPVVPALRALRRHLRERAPDVVQCWLPHACVIGSAVARVTTDAPVLWGIRSTAVAGPKTARITRAINRIGALTSRWSSDVLVACAQEAEQYHRSLGYPAERFTVIENGVDPEVFRPNPAERARQRSALGIEPDRRVVVHLARRDPMKDLTTLLDAWALVTVPATLLLVGRGFEPDYPGLAAELERRNLTSTVRCLGPRTDVPAVLAAGDVVVLSSITEGFPNAVVEAMAVGLPAVATDVGALASIVNDPTRVVPARDPIALAAALDRVLALPEADFIALGTAARARVIEHYTLRRMIDAYVTLYEQWHARGARRRRGVVPRRRRK